LCWGTKDFKCPKELEAAPAVAKCDPKFACCAPDGGVVCHKKDASAFCDPSVSGNRSFADGSGCVCPWGHAVDKSAKEPCGMPAPSPPQPFYCVHNAGKNACGECKSPLDCGGKKNEWNLCWGTKDFKCPKELEAAPGVEACDPKFACCQPGGGPVCHRRDPSSFCDPTQAGTARGFNDGTGCACPWGHDYDKDATKFPCGVVPTPGPTSNYYCVHNAGKNACGECTSPEDCGGNKTQWDLCWAEKDTLCPQEEDVLAVLAGACDTKFKCCKMPGTFCHAKDASSFCDPTVAKSRQFTDGSGCACPFGHDFDPSTGKCKGGKPPAPTGGFCMHSTPKNACGACTKPEDCGSNSWDSCWGQKDQACPKHVLFV